MRSILPVSLFVASLSVLSACGFSRQSAFAKTTVEDRTADGKTTSRTVTYQAEGNAISATVPGIIALNGGNNGDVRDHRGGAYGNALYGAQPYGQAQGGNGQLCNVHPDYCSTIVVATGGYYGRSGYGAAPAIPVGYAQNAVPPFAGQVSVNGSQSSTTTVVAANPELEAKVAKAEAAAKVAKKMAKKAIRMECERIVADAAKHPADKVKECQDLLTGPKKAEEE